MSKKKKDIWDLTPEEQMDNANDFYKFEKGKIGIMELGNIPRTLNDNGLTGDVEAKIVADIMGKKKIEVAPEAVPLNIESELSSFVSETNDKIIKNSVYGVTANSKKYSTLNDLTDNGEYEQADKEDVEEYINDAIEDEESKDDINLPLITYGYDVELGKFFVNDGIVSSVLSMPVIAAQEINESYASSLDSDFIYEKIALLMKYIITLKHPTAVFDVDEFYGNNSEYKFDRVKSYDKSKFKFFYHDSWVYCYVVDAESIDEVNDVLEKSIANKDLMNYLRFFAALSYACGSLNGAFFVEDEEFISRYYKSSHNHKEDFVKLFASDEETVMAKENEELKDDEYIFPDPESVPNDDSDVKDLQIKARAFLSLLAGEPFFGDDDDDDDWDADDEEDWDADDDNEDDTQLGDENTEDNDELLTQAELEALNAELIDDVKDEKKEEIHQENIKESLDDSSNKKESENSLVIDVITKN